MQKKPAQDVPSSDTSKPPVTKDRGKKKAFIIVGIVFLVMAVIAVGVYLFLREDRAELLDDNQSQDISQPGSESREIWVEEIDTDYEIASDTDEIDFQTATSADIVLGGIDFNDAGGSLLFNHIGHIASDGTHLILSDRNNNRVLIWNSLPTGNTPPDVVLGLVPYVVGVGVLG